MSLDRRGFLTLVGAGAVGARHVPTEWTGADWALPSRLAQTSLVRVDKNENPAGPFPSARRAIAGVMDEAGRYPGSSATELIAAIARAHRVSTDQVVMGCGSSEILRLCTEQFTSRTRALVAGAPTFEDPAAIAGRLERPVVTVPVTADMRLDLDAMAARATGAGLVFLCNPNNPTSTVHGADAVRAFIQRVRRASPGTMILVDEAYHEYVDDRGYATMIPETRDPSVIVSRTFSKVFGMAGLRAGYAIAAPETAARLRPWALDANVNRLAIAAALASLGDTAALTAEQARNRDVRTFVTGWFTGRGYTVAASATNFVFANIRRDVNPVISGCLSRGVAVGRPFPPLTTHLRVSLGTQPEMERAMDALGRVLA